MDPVVLFFLLGVLATLVKSDLKLPEAVYEALSIFLLLAIGLKGGVELARQPLVTVAPQALAAVVLGAAIPLVVFPVLSRVGRLGRPDSAAIAGHYGSVSVVTFAVAVSFLAARDVPTEPYMPLFVALMEAPGIVVAIVLARTGGPEPIRWRLLAHEVLAGRSVLLLIGGLAIGAAIGPAGIEQIAAVFVAPFKGLLAIFLLQMGLIAGSRITELRRAGAFLVAFGLSAPIVLAVLGAVVGRLVGLSEGGITLLATLAASASYIAAPTAMRIAVPEANPALSIGVVLGVTFPFNVTAGVPLYLAMARLLS